MVINRFRRPVAPPKHRPHGVRLLQHAFLHPRVNCESHRRELKSGGEWKSVEINFERCRGSQLPVHRIHGGCAFPPSVVQRTEVDSRTMDIAFSDRVLHIQMHRHKRLGVHAEETHTLLQWQRGKREELRHTEQRLRVGASALLVPSRRTPYSSSLTAMLKNFYVFLLRRIHKTMPNVKPNFRLKKFLISFVIVRRNGSRTGRRPVLNLYTKKGLRPCILFHLGRTSFDSHFSPLAWVGILCGHCNKSAKTSKLYSILRLRAR